MEELGDLVVDLTTLLHEGRDLLDGMNHSCVISAAELAGDGGIAEIGELAEHVHPDLAGRDEWAPTAGTAQLFNAEAERRRCRLEDHPRCDSARLACVDDVRQHSSSKLEVHRLVVETGKRGHPYE